jgi:hypothetical protein
MPHHLTWLPILKEAKQSADELGVVEKPKTIYNKNHMDIYLGARIKTNIDKAANITK